MSYDLGDVATLGITIKDSTGIAANAGAVVCTITLPDGTTTTPSVTNSPTGSYQIAYTPTQIGLHGIRWVATGANAGAVTDAFVVDDPAYVPAISLADAKLHINLTVSTYDEKVRGMVETATAIAENYCNRPIARRTFVETFSGGKTFVQLRNPTVLSITSVTENGVTLQATDYACQKLGGVLTRGMYAYSYPFVIGVDNVTVTYVAGPTNPPPGMLWGVKEIFRWMWDNTQQSPRPGYNRAADQGLLSDALPKWLLRPLDPFRMPGLG